jgi:hypothetical protein
MNAMLIIGSAPCVHDDLRHAVEIIRHAGAGYSKMCIGLTASDMHAAPVKYLATYHPALLPDIRQRREVAGGNTDYIIISHEAGQGVSIIEPLLPGERSGSSALLGTLAALKLGYARIILCGCPMTGENDKGNKYESFRVGWTNKQKFLNDRVRSMGGWTQELLGAPTDEWLKEAQA